MTPRSTPGPEEREAARILSREGAVTGGEDDWAERWGRRIGAVLGPVLVGLALLWLVGHLISGAPAA